MPEHPETAAADRGKAPDIQPLRGLLPFIRPYRGQVALAVFALVATACLSLILPVAVRQIVDGFGNESIDLLQQYFVLALFVAGLLALGSGLRYALVTRLGERVVADIRKAVFSHMISMSPRFYERILTGEVLSRLITDTTLVLSVVSFDGFFCSSKPSRFYRRHRDALGHQPQTGPDRSSGGSGRLGPDTGTRPKTPRPEPRQSGLDRQEFRECVPNRCCPCRPFKRIRTR